MTDLDQPDARQARRSESTRAGTGLHWWVEILLVLTFYVIYSAVRNRFGSDSVGVSEALANAERVIDLERTLGLYLEPGLQAAFLGQRWFIQFWNLFYGTFHFGLTVFALVWVYRYHPHLYGRQRSTFLCTTGLALVGFGLFPLMPPRLLSDCGEFGACLAAIHPFVDTVAITGGLWSFDSGTMQAVSNQYAAMPSLHFAWAAWCTVALWPVVTSRTGHLLIAAYAPATLFAVVVTANHFWIDALGGLAALGAGHCLSGLLLAGWRRLPTLT
jgi:hypothetical protein|tara:strand:+ start:83 stop:898 length:816 start_codon:yes stop_codon:yes gene_type:complete